MTTDLCRGWTEDKVVYAVTHATELQRAILRLMAHRGTATIFDIAGDAGVKAYAVAGSLSRWYQDTTRPLGVVEPATGVAGESWPFYIDRVRINGRLAWRYRMPSAVAMIVLRVAGP